MNPATTGRQQVVFVSSYLQGSARTWLAAAQSRDPERQHELADWPHMRKAMLKFFGPKQMARVVRANLQAMRQTKSTHEFVTRFNDELMKLESGLDADTVMDWFNNGLRDNVALELATRSYDTLEEMQDAAIAVDEALAVHAKRARSSSHQSQSTRQSQVSRLNEMNDDDDQHELDDDDELNSAQASKQNSMSAQLNKLQQQLNAMSTKGKSQPKRRQWSAEQQKRFDNNECFNCGSTDHKVKDCSKPKQKN